MRWLIGIAVVMLIAHILFKRAERAEARRAGAAALRVPEQDAKQDA